MNFEQALMDFREHVLRVGLMSRWDNHLTVPLHKNTIMVIKLVQQRADPQIVAEAAKAVEGSLLICASSRIANMNDTDRLIDDLYSIIEAYEKGKTPF